MDDADLIAWGIDEIPGASVLVFDRDLRYQLVRGGPVRRHGLFAEDLEGRIGSEVLPPHRWAYLEPMYREALAGQMTLTEVDSPDGDRRYLIRTAPIRDGAGEVVGGVSVATDITDLRAAQRLGDATQRRLRLTFDSAPIGMALEDLDGRFVEVNDALATMLDRPSAWLLEHSVVDVIDDRDGTPDLSERTQLLEGTAPSVACERMLLRSDGERLWVLHTTGLLTDEQGAPLSYLSHFVDITETRGARDRMHHLATHDHLTGLLNREGFWDHISAVSGHPPRGGLRLALLFCDLDDFKVVNDRHGHVIGDQVLAEVAQRLRTALRRDDLVARFGGDEFVILLTAVRDEAAVRMVAENLHEALRDPVPATVGDVPVSISIGAAMLDPRAPVDTALNRADAAMYQAKARGGGHTVLASSGLVAG